MKYKLIMGIYLLIASYQTASASDQVECEIEFKLNSAVRFENKEDLDACLNKLSQKKVDAVTIVGSASPSGSVKRNKQLAHERALTISGIVKAKFPDASIKEIGVGANEKIGKKSQVHFIVSDNNQDSEQPKLQDQVQNLQEKIDNLEGKVEEKDDKLSAIDRQLSEQAQASQARKKEKEDENNKKSFLEGNPNFRLAARVGLDSTRVELQRNYLSAGGEIAWLNRESSFRPELGVKASTSINEVKINDETVSHVTNVYGFLGVGAAAQGFVSGVRLLGGEEWININKELPQQHQFALGGEARLGYEWKRGMSVFASYGLTEHLQMIGVDVGVSL